VDNNIFGVFSTFFGQNSILKVPERLLTEKFNQIWKSEI
jgi:hypothetical protein